MAFLQFARNLVRHRRLVGEMHFGHGSRMSFGSSRSSSAMPGRLPPGFGAPVICLLLSGRRAEIATSDIRLTTLARTDGRGRGAQRPLPQIVGPAAQRTELGPAVCRCGTSGPSRPASGDSAPAVFAGAADGPRGLRRRAAVYEHLFVHRRRWRASVRCPRRHFSGW